ncbi:MAG: helicase [Betaproteobacteria bacterium RIFCSPLOWO2_12_FULL_62_58]|nr:MAG: helicase [Betaproteobacteria bacterium RIFCSPLOWO2_12_FULL_62_58]
MFDLDSLFSEQGPLAQVINDFRARPFQLEMARAVAEAIGNNAVLVAEAGTGTGKTFAYLVPALMSGGKVIISTGTKNLQDQLFDRDIPTVREGLKVPVTVALLKGRANYVCHYHLERTLAGGRLPTREDARHLALIERFARVSQIGDRADCSTVPEGAGVWSYVTSTRENCLGSDCRHYDRCFVMAARKQALAADVVVVNHHLFFADLVLRDEGAGELLPACNTVIFDEAHQLPETASLFFGDSVSTSQYIELARDTRIEAAASAKDYAPLPEAAQALDKAARDLRLVFREDNGRLPLRMLDGHRAFESALGTVLAGLDELAAALHGQAQRSEGLERCWQRTLTLAEQTERWRSGADGDRVRWVELFSHSLHLNSTPLSIAENFRKQMEGQARSWIFTSATLSVGSDFSHYCGEMGLADGRSVSWDSPFDYARQALLYVPEGLPDPNTPEHTPAVIEAALPLLKASGGRAFMLFTSLRAMREGHALLKKAFERRSWGFPLLVQGEGSRSELLERFRRLGNAVLVGSQSFWEGVDVRGEALSVVVIDKLPFAAPDDPVLAARIDRMNREGRNAFLGHQLPKAVITLKQGAGRLIRDEHDRGVLMICDPRLASRSYGKMIVRSLPPMKRTRNLAEVTAFLETCRGEVPALAGPFPA